MSLSDHDDDLFREMKTLIFRYGSDRCQEALDDAKLCSFPNTIKKKFIPPHVVDLLGSKPTFSLSDILEWCFTENNRKISLNIAMNPPSGVTSNELESILSMMETYYDYTTKQKRLLQHDFEMRTEIVRTESRFDTLHLYVSQTESLWRVIEWKKAVALFDGVKITGRTLYLDSLGVLGGTFFHEIVELVTEGVISSLTISECFCHQEVAVGIVGLLRQNTLMALDCQVIPLNEQYSHPLCQALTHSLQSHIDLFQGQSRLKVLDLRDSLHNAFGEDFEDLFTVLGILPNLDSFGMTVSNIALLETIAGEIGSWKIRCFKLRCDFPANAMLNPNFEPLFGAIATSRYLKTFSFDYFAGYEFLPFLLSRHLFDLALSPVSRLIEIDIVGALVDIRHLSTLVPDEFDPTIAARSTLRHFDFVQNQFEGIIENNSEDEALLMIMEALLRLLCHHLPRLHSIGLTIDDWLDHEKELFNDDSPRFGDIWKQILVQIERNHVGFALFQPSVLPSVPAGLWAKVLHRAISYDEDPEELPWIGIYHMVRELLGGGYTGLGHSDQAMTTV